MVENKTQPSRADANAFLEAVPDPVRRADGRTVAALMARISGEPAVLWGPSIVGFGSCHYRYDSGREGDMPRIAFSPRKAETVLYLSDTMADREELMARLGKHRAGKSCIYIKRVADIDMDVLEKLVAGSWSDMAQRYPVD